MYVEPAARGQGIGRRILAFLEDRAAAAGYRDLWLETGTMQPEAISLYISFGYEPIPPYGEFRDHPLSRCYSRNLGT